MESTYRFDDYTVKLNNQCEIYLDGYAAYRADWIDGTTSTPHGKMNCRMELQGVEILELQIDTFIMVVKVGTQGTQNNNPYNDWITVSEDKNLHGDNFSCAPTEFREWVEKQLRKDGVFAQDIEMDAEGKGAPDPDDYALNACGDDPHGD